MSTKTKSSDAFAIAKEALQLVGEFRTPPTPEVYAVWYRYVEGANETLRQQLAHAVTEAKSVNVELLESIYEQFCVDVDETGAKVGQSLAEELRNFQSLVDTQKAAGTAFGGSIESASEMLSADDQSNESVIACVDDLNSSSIAMRQQLDLMFQKLNASQQHVAVLQSELVESQRGMMTDALTGIWNRRFFDTLITQTIEKHADNGVLTYLALLDMDRLKSINDTYGHDAGDRFICFMATQVNEIRPDVSLARLGGDEFAAFLRVESRDQAVQFTDEVREHFATNQVCIQQSNEVFESIGVSMGVALLRPADDESSWFKRADKLLYRAKEFGRNRAVVEKAVN